MHADVTVQAEWDKYFPLEQNTGDLDIPNFDFTDFNGGFGGQQMDISALMGGGGPSAGATMGTGPGAAVQPDFTANVNLPTAEDLADVDFTPSFYTQYTTDRQRLQGQW